MPGEDRFGNILEDKLKGFKLPTADTGGSSGGGGSDKKDEGTPLETSLVPPETRQKIAFYNKVQALIDSERKFKPNDPEYKQIAGQLRVNREAVKEVLEREIDDVKREAFDKEFENLNA